MSERAPCALRGDEADLYRRYNPRLLRTVRSVIHGSDALVEDACQYAWTTLLRRQPDRDSLLGWLATVAIHEAYRLSRQALRHAALDDLAPGLDDGYAFHTALHADIDLEQRALRNEEHETRRRAFARLSDKQRRYLVLHAAGYRYQEIAAANDVTYTNVNRHITEGRARLRELAATRASA